MRNAHSIRQAYGKNQRSNLFFSDLINKNPHQKLLNKKDQVKIGNVKIKKYQSCIKQIVLAYQIYLILSLY